MSPEFFNSLSTQLKLTVVKTDKVIFLRNALKSLLPPPNTHPAEKLNTKKFNQKYYKKISAPYIIEEVESASESSSSDGRKDSNKGSSIDLTLTSDEEEEDDMQFYGDGEIETEKVEDSDDDESSDEDYQPVKASALSESEGSYKGSSDALTEYDRENVMMKSAEKDDQGKGKEKQKQKED